MSIDDEYQILSRLELFEHIDHVQLKRLIFASQRYQMNQGDYLFKKGDNSVNPFGVISGELSVLLESADGEISIAVLGPGALIGEMAAISGEPRNASVKATCSCEVIEFESELFISTVINSPKTAFQMMKLLSKRIVRMNSQIENVSS
ncbi:MAG: Crp/Fnr family transcriptional regulator [Granulosicoccus sp.]|nr:Crp/Fnr family transcriptional regulator [Granulosicoccus sp.]